ncbi:MAG: prolipoprotein diacylglyceryl transferase [Oscillospiraceae bacterium]|jgi:phosphatidylglycerol:prolipoprotein diacylglycerol transferase|nr:prolipoprotein diacylglyceryl transferase [Oscillospiraceae bacterium]
MMPFVYLNGTPMSMYFLMGLAGFLFAFIIALAKRRAFQLRVWDILGGAVLVMIGVLLGARLLAAFGYILLNRQDAGFWTAENWNQIVRGGGVFYGGLLGSMGMVALYAKLRHMESNNLFNPFAYCVLAFQSLARIGCYFVGCCYGIELANGAHFPVQLFEAGYCAAALLVFLLVKPERRWPEMPLFPLTLITYSAGRFVLEFFRGDVERGIWWFLSTSQWIALALIALSIVWLYKSQVRKKHS